VSRVLVALCSALLVGCATDVHRAVSPGMASAEVGSRVGKPSTVGKLADGSMYWDYSRQPYYTDRVSFGPDDRVREVRNLLTEQNYENLRPGMTLDQVVATVGPSYIRNMYANGTTVWTYRYQDVGIWKLLHVTLDAAGRLLRYETEWDPNVYSKKDGGK
jgi:outer membrane protein assembly factor BamE (lipoprotein component of BamABCDE complex)